MDSGFHRASIFNRGQGVFAKDGGETEGVENLLLVPELQLAGLLVEVAAKGPGRRRREAGAYSFSWAWMG